jgi:hypothetical protein
VLALALSRSHLVARCACHGVLVRLWSGDQAPCCVAGPGSHGWIALILLERRGQDRQYVLRPHEGRLHASETRCRLGVVVRCLDLSTHWLDIINCVVCSCNVRAMCLQWQGYQEGMESMAQGIAIPRQGHGKSPLRLLPCPYNVASEARTWPHQGNGIERARGAGHLSKARQENGTSVARTWQGHGKIMACFGIELVLPCIAIVLAMLLT